MLSMNRLDYHRQALSPESQTSSKTPRLPPPLRAFALRTTVSTFHSPIRMRDHRQVSPLYARRRQSARVLSGDSPASPLLPVDAVVVVLRFLRPQTLDESPGLQSPSPFTGISDFLKPSASSSASPRLRVKNHSLDLPLTHPMRDQRQVSPLYERHISRCGGFPGTLS